MKKYQLWLERKTYSQHLNNLMRIKIANTDRMSKGKFQRLPRSTHIRTDYSINNSTTKMVTPKGQADISYAVSTREFQKHNMRLVQSNQMVRENINMSKRLNKVRPFVSNTRPIDYGNYKMKRKRERENEQNSNFLKLKNYQKYAAVQNQKMAPDHRYSLSVNLQEIDHRIDQRHFNQLSLEIMAPNTIAKSEFIEPKDLKNKTFQLSFDKGLPEQFSLQINCFKGLEQKIIGKYQVLKPQQGITVKGQWPALGQCGHLTGSLTYKRILPKFWNVKRVRS